MSQLELYKVSTAKLIGFFIMAWDLSRLKADMLVLVAPILLVCTPSCLSVSAILSLSQWDHSNPIPNILLGPHWDKAYWGMLVYPYELNGRQLYQDHPAGQGYSARGYDVAKQIFFSQPLLYPPWVITSHPHWRNKNTPTFVVYISSTADWFFCFFCFFVWAIVLVEWSMMPILAVGALPDFALHYCDKS